MMLQDVQQLFSFGSVRVSHQGQMTGAAATSGIETDSSATQSEDQGANVPVYS